jgi:hypothetical protein
MIKREYTEKVAPVDKFIIAADYTDHAWFSATYSPGFNKYKVKLEGSNEYYLNETELEELQQVLAEAIARVKVSK